MTRALAWIFRAYVRDEDLEVPVELTSHEDRVARDQRTADVQDLIDLLDTELDTLRREEPRDDT